MKLPGSDGGSFEGFSFFFLKLSRVWSLSKPYFFGCKRLKADYIRLSKRK
jgi:hypothetical protein